MKARTKNELVNIFFMFIVLLITSELMDRFITFTGTLNLVIHLLLGFSIGFFWVDCEIFKEEQVNG